MNRFYNICIIAGWVGGAAIAMLIYYSGLPWWKWLIFFPSYAAVEFGCFAWRDKANETRARQSQPSSK